MKKLTKHFKISHAIPLISHPFASAFSMYLYFFLKHIQHGIEAFDREIKLPLCQQMTMAFATGDT